MITSACTTLFIQSAAHCRSLSTVDGTDDWEISCCSVNEVNKQRSGSCLSPTEHHFNRAQNSSGTSLCHQSYVSAPLHQPGQPLHQVRDKNDVHDVCEVRRPAGEGHQLLAQRLSVGGVDGNLEAEGRRKGSSSPAEEEIQESLSLSAEGRRARRYRQPRPSTIDRWGGVCCQACRLVNSVNFKGAKGDCFFF